MDLPTDFLVTTKHDVSYPRITKQPFDRAPLLRWDNKLPEGLMVEVRLPLREDEGLHLFQEQFYMLERQLNRSYVHEDDNIILVGRALFNSAMVAGRLPALESNCICLPEARIHVQAQSMTGQYCLLLAQLEFDFPELFDNWLGDAHRRRRRLLACSGSYATHIGRRVDGRPIFMLRFLYVPPILALNLARSVMELLGRFCTGGH